MYTTRQNILARPPQKARNQRELLIFLAATRAKWGERSASSSWCVAGSANIVRRIVRISAYTNQSRVSHSVRMRENSA